MLKRPLLLQQSMGSRAMQRQVSWPSLLFLLLILLASLATAAVSVSQPIHSPSNPAPDLDSTTDGKPQSNVQRQGQVQGHVAADPECCQEHYGALPCSTSLPGNFFLMLCYGGVLLYAAKLISDGSELLLEVLDPGVVGGLVLPVLGALPDACIIAVSGLGGTLQEAQEQVVVGMGTLAGSTVMLLSVVWGAGLLVGRCDLGRGGPNGNVGRAVDGQRTKPWWDLVGTGVTTDSTTPANALIMLASALPMLIVQLPVIFGTPEYTDAASLVALVLALLMLAAYCVYQVLVPDLQLQRMKAAREKFVSSYSMRSMHHMAVESGGVPLITIDGKPNIPALEAIFTQFDTNGDGAIDRQEVKMLVCALTFGAHGFIPRDCDAEFYLRHFDRDNSHTISLTEFIDGISQWMNEFEYQKQLTLGGESTGWQQQRQQKEGEEREQKLELGDGSNGNGIVNGHDGSSGSSSSSSGGVAPEMAVHMAGAPARVRASPAAAPAAHPLVRLTNSFNSMMGAAIALSISARESGEADAEAPSNGTTPLLPSLEELDDEEGTLGAPLLPKKQENGGEEEAAEQQGSEGGEGEGGNGSLTPTQPARKTHAVVQAVCILVLGTVILGIFADPLVDTVSEFARLSNLPAFFVSFIATPLASNASELYSSIAFATGMKRKNITLTFSQVYGAVTMNNTMCLGVFLALIFARGIPWDFSAEVTVLLTIIFLMGVLGSSRTTFRAWVALGVLALYPFSLALVGFLDYALGWQ